MQFQGWFEDHDNWYIATEFIPYGNLEQHIIQRRLDEGEAVTITSQIALALHYMHSEGFIHRDLKPAVRLSPAHAFGTIPCMLRSGTKASKEHISVSTWPRMAC